MPRKAVSRVRLNTQLFSGPTSVYKQPFFVAVSCVVIVVLISLAWNYRAELFSSPEKRFQEAYDAGNLEEALKIAIELARENPDSLKPFHAIAAIYIERALNGVDVEFNINSALRIMQDAEKVDRSNPDTQRFIGFILDLSGDSDAAVERYKRALEVDPTDASTLSQLGALIERQGDIDTAKVYYRKAISAEPYNDQARILYAQSLLGDGEFVSALSQAKLVADRATNLSIQSEASRIIAVARLAQGNYLLAASSAEDAVSQDPNSAKALSTLAEIQFRNLFAGVANKDFDDALVEIRNTVDLAIKIDPTMAQPYFIGYKVAYSQNDKVAASRYEETMREVIEQDKMLNEEQKKAMILFVETVPNIKLTPK